MIKAEDAILINDHNEYLLRVVNYNEFCRPRLLEQKNSKRIASRKIKQNKTQKQSHEKEHNKQLRFHRAGIKLIKWIYFHSTFNRKPYLKEKNYLKLIELNYFDVTNSRCVLEGA